MLYLLGIALLLVASAAMSASEVALFSLGPVQLRDLEERGGARGRRVLDLLARPKRLLATILIANNLVNIALIILSGMAISALIDLSTMPDELVFAVQVLLVAFLLLLLGEVVPKVYATSHGMRVALFMAPILMVLRWLFTPINETLLRSTSFIEKRYRKRTTRNFTVDNLEHALELTHDASTTEEEKRILGGIVKFGNKEVRQIMRPRTEMVSFDKELDLKELLARIVDTGFSRVPVYEETQDRIVGILHIKDVLPHIDKEVMDWLPLLREPYFVPESKKLDDLLKEFQEKKVHQAIVVDEYGGTSGLVTLEDVIEEIVGEINDEYDEEDLIYSKLDDHTWVFEGRAQLTDVYRVMGVDGKLFDANKGDSETLGGFILELSGHIPVKGERFALQQYAFVVESADNKRVRRVKVTIKAHEA